MLTRRPKPGDTEEDILKYQQEFLSSQSVPSASVVKKSGEKRKSGGVDKKEDVLSTQRDVVHLPGLPTKAPDVSSLPPVKRSRFKASREKQTTDPEEQLDRQDTSTAAILTEIIERDTRNAGIQFPHSSPYAFPVVRHGGSTQSVKTTASSPISGGPSKSLFAQQLERDGDYKTSVTSHSLDKTRRGPLPAATVTSRTAPSHMKSNMLHGCEKLGQVSAGDMERIHQENLAMLSNMSSEEILSEQNKLLETVDPKILAYLKSKRSTNKDSYAKATDSNIVQSKSVSMETLRNTPMEITQTTNMKELRTSVTSEDSTEVPIPVNTNWLHMNVVETEKLAWMKNLPTPRAGHIKTDRPARFDFHGDLVFDDLDLPVTLGLHHHGDEPERAGYTLEELFILCRSSNIQQRCLSLQTLARLITKAKAGEFTEQLETTILPTILEAGVIFLIRWSLDDSIETVVSGALSALCAIVINPRDEAALEEVFSWHGGISVVAQYPVSVMEETREQESEMEEDRLQEIDADVLKNDLISGLVKRMSILPRLHHFLSKCRHQAPSILSILALLTRISRHSQELAYQVLSCRGLVDTIVTEFLPSSWTPIDTSQPLSHLYGYPVPAAVRLLRTIAQAGRNMAAILMVGRELPDAPVVFQVSQYKVLSRVMPYVAMDTSELALPLEEGVVLQTESFKLWKVSLLYGLGSQHYLDMYPTLIKRLRSLHTVDFIKINDRNIALHSSFIGLLEAVVVVTGNCLQNSTKSSNQTPVVCENVQPNLSWKHVQDLVLPVRALWEKLQKEIIQNFQHMRRNLTVTSVLTDFLATFYRLQSKQPGVDIVSLLEEIENSPVLTCEKKSLGFQTILNSISEYSNLLVECEVRDVEVSPSLPEHRSTVNGDLIPVLKPNTVIPYVNSVLRLSLNLCLIHRGLIPKMLQSLIGDKQILAIVKRIVTLTSPSCLHRNYFTKFENQLHYHLVKLASLTVTPGGEMKVYHSLALHLLTRLQHGDEHLAHDLLSVVIFNPSFISECSSEDLIRESLQGIHISEDTFLKSATDTEMKRSCSRLLSDAFSSLSSIRAAYLASFRHMTQAVQMSRARHLGHPMETESFLTNHIGECLLPADWMFSPLVDLYNSSLNQSSLDSSNRSLSLVTNCLRWIYLLECRRPKALSMVSVPLRLSRAMCVFLADNDLFLDPTVHCYLAAILRELVKPKNLELMNLELDIPGVDSFQDLYISFLHQYQAVSFGDALYGCYVLIPLQRRHSKEFKKAVWGEFGGLLRTLSTPVKELLIPIQCYLEPDEDDVELIRLYTQNLLAESVRPDWSPVMYLVAVHHVSRFIYTQDGHQTSLKQLILKQINALPNQELKTHILWYKSFNTDRPLGMELYDKLPPIREKLLRRLGTE